jgi:hypothetical protein
MKIQIFAAIGIALAAAAQQPGVNFYSIEKEIEIGRQQARELAGTLQPLDRAETRAYVDRVVATLAKQMADTRFSYIVTLVQGGIGPEPRVLMGGQIFLSTEQIGATRSETEFIELLATAMARVVNRDASRTASRNELRRTASAQPERVRDFDLQAEALAAKTMLALGYSRADRKDSEEYLRMRESAAK